MSRSHLSWVALALSVQLAACGPPAAWYGLSPDHRTTFSVSESSGRSCVRVASEEQRCFDGVALHHIIFSPDSRHMAYPIEDGKEWYVVHDGRRGPAADGVGELLFSPDGERLAYSAEREGAWYVVVDGEWGEPFDSLFAGSLVFDPSGRRLAFAAQRGAFATTIVDGIAGPNHDGIGDIRFSPDGLQLGYVTRGAEGVWLTIDGVAGRMHDAIAEFRFGSSGTELAYISQDSNGWWVVTDSDSLGPYSEALSLAYRPDGEITFVIREKEGEQVLVGGEAGPPFRSVDAPVFSRSGTRWGYIGHDSVQSVVVLDGVEGAAQEWAGNLVFNNDGTRHAYLARRDGGDVIVHDQGMSTFDLVVDGTLLFTSGGERWACLAGDFDGQRLWVTVEGLDEIRPLEWSDFAGVVGSQTTKVAAASAVREALRAWVATEAEAILSGAR